MSVFKNIENIYFIGIGGIGMSALARYFHFNGKRVIGYDKTPSAMTRKLMDEGMNVQFDQTLEYVTSLKVENTLVVYTPAVSPKNKVLCYFQEKEFTIKKRAAVLGMITEGIPTLAVAGTHGKTTTSTILAHILKTNGTKLTAFMGGVSENYHSNVILDGNEAVVVEADEFDRSFLQLHPTMAAVTSMDADHLDIYGENEQLQKSFNDFVDLLPAHGELFYKNGLPLKDGLTIDVGHEADFFADQVRVKNGHYIFDLQTPNGVLKDFSFSLPGKHNLMNTVTASAMAITFGVKTEKLREALATFRGVERRFSYRIKTDKRVLIDDYAHHPTEIKAVHQAIREMFPEKAVLAVFQPHLYSRTRDFADDFAESLSLFDQVLLLDIYPAREDPIDGVDSQMLLKKMSHSNKKVIGKSDLLLEVKKSHCPVVVLMGAGDIGKEVEPLKNGLGNEI